ncbi:MAG: hypothetical protein E6767_05115 [Dysgonomonas sp.]|nr:hypothetical protein [Dysgonomonas sp.]
MNLVISQEMEIRQYMENVLKFLEAEDYSVQIRLQKPKFVLGKAEVLHVLLW